nr:protein kinase-like domain, phloem protein 2-like protein [Tanacetum cinerariifolium]
MLNANCQKFNAAYKRAKHFGKSGENDVDVMKRVQNIYRDEHERVAFCQEDAWAILKFHPKWDAPEQVDLTGDVIGATQEDLFGHDARPRSADKPRPAKKTKSDATASTGESIASTQFRDLLKQELRLKRKAAERAFKAQAEKDRTLMRLEELRFLATSIKDLDDDAYWIKKQKRLIKNKTRNVLGDEDDEDDFGWRFHCFLLSSTRIWFLLLGFVMIMTRRLEISVGIAQALSYIHYDESRDFSVIHRNINSGSVYLNDDWEPKLERSQRPNIDEIVPKLEKALKHARENKH